MTDKLEALFVLMRDVRSPRLTTTSARRVLKAAKVLSLSDEEIRKLFYWLEYCDGEGEPYGKIAKVWK